MKKGKDVSHKLRKLSQIVGIGSQSSQRFHGDHRKEYF
jgi:hypothetical protein